MPYFIKSNDSLIVFDETGGIKLPSGANSERPSVSEPGYIRFNTDSNTIEVFNGTNWKNIEEISMSATSGVYVEKTGDVMSGSLGIISGSQTNPGLYIDGNSDTGIYAEKSNEIDITAGGTKKASFSSDKNILFGNVGINHHSSKANFEIHSTLSDFIIMKRDTYSEDSGLKIVSTNENRYDLKIANKNNSFSQSKLYIDFDLFNNTKQAIVSLFENTNSNPGTFEIFRADGTPNRMFIIQKNWGYLDTGGLFGIGGSTPSHPFHVFVSAKMEKNLEVSSPSSNILNLKSDNESFIKISTNTEDWKIGIDTNGDMVIYHGTSALCKFDKNDIITSLVKFEALDKAKFNSFNSYKHEIISFLSSKTVNSPFTIILSASSSNILDFPENMENGTILTVINKSETDISLSSVGFYIFSIGSANSFIVSSNTSYRFLFDSSMNKWFDL